MNSQKLIDCLLFVTANVYHFFSKDTKFPYIVWKENSEGSEVAADNKKIQYSLNYSVDLYLKKPNASLIKNLETKFNNARISFQLTNVEYDNDTEIINYHYEVEL